MIIVSDYFSLGSNNTWKINLNQNEKLIISKKIKDATLRAVVDILFVNSSRDKRNTSIKECIL